MRPSEKRRGAAAHVLPSAASKSRFMRTSVVPAGGDTKRGERPTHSSATTTVFRSNVTLEAEGGVSGAGGVPSSSAREVGTLFDNAISLGSGRKHTKPREKFCK